MGIGPFRNCRITEAVFDKKVPNPNPENFDILLLVKSGEFTVAKVKYPDCTNYEGEKILVFKGDVSKELSTAKELDPHFSKDNKLSPIARFKPNAEGLRLALSMGSIS